MKNKNHNVNLAKLVILFKYKTTHIQRILVIYLLGLTAPLASTGQNVDSLKSLLHSEFGQKRQEILYELAYYYTDVDNHQAMSFVNEGSKLSEVFGDSLSIVKYGRLKSLLYRRFDKMDSSLFLSEEILRIAERNKFELEIGKILNGLAIVYTFKSSYEKALISYLRILDSFNSNENKAEASVILNNIGLVYFKLGNVEKALQYYDESLSLKKAVRDTFDLDRLFVNISTCHGYMGNYRAAKEFNDMAIGVCKTKCSMTLMARAEFNVGLILYGNKDLTQSEFHFFKSYELAKVTHDQRLQIDNLIQLFQIYNDTHDLPAGITLLAEVEPILSGKPFYTDGVIQLYGQLMKIYDKSGDTHKVAQYQASYIHLKDSVFNEKLTANLMTAEAEFLERENRAKLEAQNRVLELSDDIIKRQRTLNVVAAIVAILLVVVVILLLQNIKQKKRNNILLEARVIERTIELQNSHDSLLKTITERDIQVQRLSNEIRSSLATIKGLGVLVSHDVNTINGSNYLAKIEETSNNLIQGLSSVHEQKF